MGESPSFKAGLHGGPVVTAEIGGIKKDIVHSGDTVNTAARVEAQGHPLERRGKAEALRLFSVRSRTGEASGSR